MSYPLVGGITNAGTVTVAFGRSRTPQPNATRGQSRFYASRRYLEP
ncbi:hypothetical protein ACFQMM_18945 [Saliphagus sp. GCM10025308]